MQIIEYFEDGQKEHWIKEIEGFSWGAAKYLAKLLRENSFEDTLGKNGKLFLLIDGEKIVSFVTLTHQDCIADESLFPWLGFVFTAPEYRGRRYSELLIEHACGEAAKAGSVPVTICGLAVGNPVNTVQYLQMGLRSFSVSPQNLLHTKKALLEADAHPDDTELE